MRNLVFAALAFVFMFYIELSARGRERSDRYRKRERSTPSQKDLFYARERQRYQRDRQRPKQVENENYNRGIYLTGTSYPKNKPVSTKASIKSDKYELPKRARVGEKVRVIIPSAFREGGAPYNSPIKSSPSSGRGAAQR